jgi:hypothetical protein
MSRTLWAVEHGLGFGLGLELVVVGACIDTCEGYCALVGRCCVLGVT